MKKKTALIFIFCSILVLFTYEDDAKSYYISNPKQVYTYEQMTADIQQLAKDFPDLVEFKSLGKTTYNRDIWAVKLGYGKATTLVTSSSHGREWLTTNVTMKQILTYANGYTSNQTIKNQNVKEILDNTTIWFVPMVNPDGVTLQQTGLDAFPKEVHQKLIDMNEGSTDFKRWKTNADGIDPNRNFDIDFQLINSPPSPNWNNYKGTKPNQIIETKAISDFTYEVNPEILIAYHTAGEMLYWEYKTDALFRNRDLELTKAISNMTGYRILYNTNKPTGSHMDWFISKFKRPAITPELGVYPGLTNVPISGFDRMWSQNEVLPLFIAKKSYEYWINKQPELPVSLDIELTSSSKLFSDPLVYSGASLNPQKLIAGSEKGNLWKVKTWNGDMWLSKTYTTELPNYGFRDFQMNQYWSESMIWAIDKGLVLGVEMYNKNYLKPLDHLTEAQFLTILFRLTKLEELQMTAPAVNYWSSVSYQLANNYQLPIEGDVTADIPITRGQMARLLVAFHTSNPSVTVEEAVQFMYVNHLSNGYDEENQTLESFGINDILQRGQITKIMKNYHDFLELTSQ